MKTHRKQSPNKEAAGLHAAVFTETRTVADTRNRGQSARGTHLELLLATMRSQGYVRFRVQGGSMRPWLRGGEVVEVRRENVERIRRGDVVVFARSGGLFAHRVIGKGSRGNQPVVFTKGDAFPDADAPVRADELVGRVAAVARSGHQVRLDTLPQRALARLLARISTTAHWWYPGARATKRFLRAVLS